jgi:hypothetical protein
MGGGGFARTHIRIGMLKRICINGQTVNLAVAVIAEFSGENFLEHFQTTGFSFRRNCSAVFANVCGCTLDFRIFYTHFYSLIFSAKPIL